MPKVKKPIRAAALRATKAARHDPLGQVVLDDANKKKYAKVSGRRTKGDKKKDRRAQTAGAAEDDEERHLLDEKASNRILELSQAQQLEMEAEEEIERRRRRKQQNVQKFQDSDDEDDDNEEDSALLDDEDEQALVVKDVSGGYVTLAEDGFGLSPEDEALIASMMQPSEERRTLADIILEKIEEKEAEKRGEFMAEEGEDTGPKIPEKVINVYTDIGKILSRYTSGKLPKAFKVIPSLTNWEEVLYLTRPDLWTPQAMYAGTRIFVSNLNPKMAQRFLNLVLLDSVRADIHANKKLNYHYYMALKKAIYKPSAFFKGILLPLCKDNCTLREAAIVASVLQRVSIPVHHSAVAIHKLAQQETYSGAASIFIKTLLNKKYSLPAPVIASLVRHFALFIHDDRTLPVLWHQALLVFCQRYKNEVQDEAREALRQVMRKHFHAKITPEIRRELFGVQAFKEERKSVHGGNSENGSMVM